MKNIERCFRFNSISTLVLAFLSASIATGQQSDEYLFRPLAAENSSYFEQETVKVVSDENDSSNESNRRREIARQAWEAGLASDLPTGQAGRAQQDKSILPRRRTKQHSDLAYFSEAEPESSPRQGILQAGVNQDVRTSSRVTPAGFAMLEEKKQEPVNSGESDLEGLAPSKFNPGNLDSQDTEGKDDSGDQDPSTQKTDLNPEFVRKKIQEVRTDVREVAAVAPVDRSSELDYGMTDWTQFSGTPKVFAWVAPDIRYQPLYFEDVALERYGQTLGFHRQTVRSGFHFFMSSITFPNKLRHDSPRTCDYPLGFCRPGTCVPAIKQSHYLGHPR